MVRRPEHWPGASSTQALLDGRPLRGLWFDRTQEFEARRRGERPGKYEFTQEESFALAPLPTWSGLGVRKRRERVRELVTEIAVETRQRLQKADTTVLGKRRIYRQNPHDLPARSKRSPAPRFHARRWEVRKCLEHSYHAFRLAYRQAAEDLSRRLESAEFPPGCFPPRLPFNRAGPRASLA